MKKVLLYSLLLIVGLLGSQFLPRLDPAVFPLVKQAITFLTMVSLAFLMIHVGYEFEIDRSNLRKYAIDYGVAATAAGFPWIFCSLYFVFMMSLPESWGRFETWTESLLAARFAAPTSAGILFAMMAAAGLSATWVFRKARILAIFDDLDTVLLMIPLKMLIVGMKWQLGVIVLAMVGLLWLAWRYLHRLQAPISWQWVIGYAAAIALTSEIIYRASKWIDDVVPIHIEVLLPAFVLGCMLARPTGHDPHIDDTREGHQEGPGDPGEQRVSSIVSAVFMVLVGLSMPPLAGVVGGGPAENTGWGSILFHVLIITVLSNLGKMFPLFCYRAEAHWRERLALCIGMWPRGEVGAGVLVVSLAYGIGGPIVAVATLSLALNLLLTGLFIYAVKKLLRNLPAKDISSDF
ncbi:MAG: hypothetical protein WAO55_07695 [Candidatus Manganitrophaceae bacterium]